jgi:hypothetical protein
MTGIASGTIDVVEGDPTRLRDFSIGYGSVRTIRAEGTTTGPIVDADLHLEGSSVKGTLTNRSTVALATASLVIGNSLVELGDIAPGASVPVALTVTSFDMNTGMPLSDRLFGQIWNGPGRSEEDQRRYARHAILDQLTNGSASFGIAVPNGVVMGQGQAWAVPAMGMGGTSSLAGVVTLLAWGTTPALQIAAKADLRCPLRDPDARRAERDGPSRGRPAARNHHLLHVDEPEQGRRVAVDGHRDHDDVVPPDGVPGVAGAERRRHRHAPPG